MTEAEWQTYCQFWNLWESRWSLKPDAIIYLKTPAAVCLQRIKERNRTEEKGINLEYLETLEKLHDAWLLNLKSPLVIVLDGEREWTPKQFMETICPALGI